MRDGAELRRLVERFEMFPDVRSVRLRRPLLRLPEVDADLLMAAQRPLAGPPAETVAGYRERGGRTG
ncbi:hypothetical protein ACN3XK_72890, partial [Actinomadura welshii]